MAKHALIIILFSLIVAEFSFAKSLRISQSSTAADKIILSSMISTFDFSLSSVDAAPRIEVQNVNGQKKTAELTKIEEYEEYTKYSFVNPFAKANESHILYLFSFNKLKPSARDTKDTTSTESDISDLTMNLLVLLDSVTKKTIKTKGSFFFKESLVAEGSVENNSSLRIQDNLSSQIKNCKLEGISITKNLLGSDKRSLDFELRLTHSGKNIKHILNVNLINMKLTPIQKLEESDELDDELDREGEENETDSTHT